MDFVIRPHTQSDEGFLARSFVDTARGAHLSTRKVDAGLFNALHYVLAKDMLSSSTVRVAAPPDDETTIYGFSILQDGMVRCVYVKKAWRRLGIMRRLLEGVPLKDTAFSLWSQDVSNWIWEKVCVPNGMRYVPYWFDLRSLKGLQNGR